MDGPLDQWLGYRDCLPLKLDVLQGLPESAVLEHWHDQNLRTLHAIAVLDERHKSAEGSGNSLEDNVERLHQKLDVVLELLGAVIRANRGALPAVPVRLSREGLCWPSAEPPRATGTLLMASLELHACAPAPFCWPLRVLGQHSGETWGRFHDMTEMLGSALERFVFIRHRRSVAGARSPGTSASG